MSAKRQAMILSIIGELGGQGNPMTRISSRAIGLLYRITPILQIIAIIMTCLSGVKLLINSYTLAGGCVFALTIANAVMLIILMQQRQRMI